MGHRLDDAPGNRVLGMLLDGRRKCQQFLFGEPVLKDQRVGHAETPFGERARFVEDHRLQIARIFEGRTVTD